MIRSAFANEHQLLTDIIRDPGVGGVHGSGSRAVLGVFHRLRVIVHFVQGTRTNHGRVAPGYPMGMGRPRVFVDERSIIQRRQIFYMERETNERQLLRFGHTWVFFRGSWGHRD